MTNIEIRKKNTNVVYRYARDKKFMFMIWAKCTLPEKGMKKLVRAIEHKKTEIVVGEYKISGLN